MFNLFLRTVSQGLQAFIPVVAAWTWFRRRDPAVARAISVGALASVPVTIVAAPAFATASQKALDECLLAMAAFVAATVFLRVIVAASGQPDGPQGITPAATQRVVPLLVACATVLVIVRQSMEFGATFSAAFFDMQSFDATRAVVLGVLLPMVIAGAWAWLGARLPIARLASATHTFAVLFVLQVCVYGLHEAFEARLLPFSEVMHEASEPYGPDGMYGMHVSELLVLIPAIAAALTTRTRTTATRLAALLVPVALGWSLSLPGAAATLLAAGAEPAEVMRQPFLLFRDTTTGASFGRASVVPLSVPDGPRSAATVSCERVAFVPTLGTGARGICLNAAPTFFNLFTGYSAIFLDGSLADRRLTMKLEGKPSRTRVSPDGRFGAFTVFVFGDGYSSADFSTRTLLVEMATGATIADLETFTTFRNGERFSAKDFNFWGVTFARDGDTFYASLRSAGKTYLVRGSIATRTFATLRENVECPSLSPDGRRLAFKKFVGPDPSAWRIAVLDLATMQERLVAGETRYVDDQVEWLDTERILYAVPRRTTASSDVWMAPVEGESPARIFIPLAESPIVVR